MPQVIHHFTPLKVQRLGHLFIISKDVLAGVSFYSSHRFVSWGVFSKIGQMTHLWLYRQICVSGCIFSLFSKMHQKFIFSFVLKMCLLGNIWKMRQMALIFGVLKDVPAGVSFHFCHRCPSWCIFSLLSKLRQLAQPFTYPKDAAAGASFHYFQKWASWHHFTLFSKMCQLAHLLYLFDLFEGEKSGFPTIKRFTI